MLNIVMVAALYIVEILLYRVGSKTLFGTSMKKTPLLLMVGGIFCVVTTWTTKAELQYYELFMIVYAVVWIISFILLEEKIGKRLIILFSIFCISSCTDEIFGVVLKSLLNLPTYLNASYGVMEAFLSASFLVLGGKLVKRFNVTIEKVVEFIRKTVVLVVIWMCICLSLTVSGLLYAQHYLVEEWEKNAFNILSVMGFIGMAGIVIFVIYIKNANEKMEQLLRTERELKNMQEQYYNVLLEREADTRKYRHDMNNHLLCLYEMAAEGKIESLQAYISEMKKSFSGIQKRCYVTGNDVMDILLNYHLSELKDTEVSVIGQSSKQLAINDVEFCKIFSNIIQNAVEETNRQEGKRRYIRVKIQQGNDCLSVTVKNSSNLVWEGERKLVTSKNDKINHGIGLENVTETVMHNHGNFEFNGNGKEVTATVILPCV